MPNKDNRLISRIMASWKSTAADRIMICTAIALSGSFYYYDNYHSHMDLIRIALTGALFLTWLINALLSGRDRQYGFLIYSFLYWVLPLICILFYNSRDNVKDYSEGFEAVYLTADTIFAKPFAALGGRVSADPMLFSCMLPAAVIVAFLTGRLAAILYNKFFSSNSADCFSAAESIAPRREKGEENH